MGDTTVTATALKAAVTAALSGDEAAIRSALADQSPAQLSQLASAAEAVVTTCRILARGARRAPVQPPVLTALDRRPKEVRADGDDAGQQWFQITIGEYAEPVYLRVSGELSGPDLPERCTLYATRISSFTTGGTILVQTALDAPAVALAPYIDLLGTQKGTRSERGGGKRAQSQVSTAGGEVGNVDETA